MSSYSLVSCCTFVYVYMGLYVSTWQYVASLQGHPTSHLASVLLHIELVLDSYNIMSIIGVLLSGEFIIMLQQISALNLHLNSCMNGGGLRLYP